MDLQKASVWKRVSAWLLDIILLATLTVGAVWALSAIFQYDGYFETYDTAMTAYQEQYGITFDIAQTDYESLTPEQKANWDAAYEALISDREAMQAYNMVINLSMLTVSLGIFISILLLEYLVPLLLGNGMTVGKKVFSLAVVRVDSVRVTPLQLFVRTLLGKFTLETMLPVYLLIMIFFNGIGMIGIVAFLVIMLAQVVSPVVSRDHRSIHDFLAGTVVVDYSSQQIFRTAQDLVNYKTKLHSEKVARKDY